MRTKNFENTIFYLQSALIKSFLDNFFTFSQFSGEKFLVEWAFSSSYCELCIRELQQSPLFNTLFFRTLRRVVHKRVWQYTREYMLVVYGNFGRSKDTEKRSWSDNTKRESRMETYWSWTEVDYHDKEIVGFEKYKQKLKRWEWIPLGLRLFFFQNRGSERNRN